jgi:hypothetical protein
MPTLAADTRRELGMRAAHSRMLQQNKVWAKYSNDKVDVAHVLAGSSGAAARAGAGSPGVLPGPRGQRAGLTADRRGNGDSHGFAGSGAAVRTGDPAHSTTFPSPARTT